jgi:hypothetical protein
LIVEVPQTIGKSLLLLLYELFYRPTFGGSRWESLRKRFPPEGFRARTPAREHPKPPGFFRLLSLPPFIPP